MINFISENISYLVRKGKHTQDDFGLLFDLKKGVVNQYLLGKSNPKIETIQRICEHFNITIDAFINTSLEEQGGKFTKKEAATNVATNVETATKEIAVRDELIAFYKEKVERMEKEANNNSKKDQLFKMVEEIHHVVLRNDIKQSINNSTKSSDKKDFPEKSV